MIDDAIGALERVARILESTRSGIGTVEGWNPQYANGANFVYQMTADLIQKEIDYIMGQRAAQEAGLQKAKQFAVESGARNG